MGKNRFYCTECGGFEDRRFVSAEGDGNEIRYYCNFCGSPVIKVEKIKRAMIKDYIDYVVQRGEEDKYH